MCILCIIKSEEVTTRVRMQLRNNVSEIVVYGCNNDDYICQIIYKVTTRTYMLKIEYVNECHYVIEIDISKDNVLEIDNKNNIHYKSGIRRNVHDLSVEYLQDIVSTSNDKCGIFSDIFRLETEIINKKYELFPNLL